MLAVYLNVFWLNDLKCHHFKIKSYFFIYTGTYYIIKALTNIFTNVCSNYKSYNLFNNKYQYLQEKEL